MSGPTQTTTAPGTVTDPVRVSPCRREAPRSELAETLATALHRLVAAESGGLPVERRVGLRASGDAVVTRLRADELPATAALDTLTDETTRAVAELDHADNFGAVSRLSEALSVVVSITTELTRRRR
ncbi:MAG: hypothetical protein J07HB67_00506 [halophilic archaeon J07HB67]|nr:MAG: hypothetical protein J07HB67_00506 [halophilic archaeon J07HB67]